MTTIIGISGKIGSGKDYLATHLIAELEERRYFASRASFAYPLKAQMNEILADMLAGYSVAHIAKKYNIPFEQAIQLISFVAQEQLENPGLNAYDRSQGIRSALQYLGTDVRRAVDKTYWVRLFHENLAQDADFTFVTDVRFPNEADSILDVNGIMLRLEVPEEIILDRTQNRDGIQYTVEQLNHRSETELDNYSKFAFLVGYDFDAAAIVDRLLSLTTR